MSNVESAKSSFFPATKTKPNRPSKPGVAGKVAPIERNDVTRTKEIDEKTAKDAKVDISDAIKDFSKIKRAVDAAVPVDNTDKISALKKQINEGTYQVDYDAIADRILQSEF